MSDTNRPPLSPAAPEPVGDDAHLSAEDHEDCVASPATAQAAETVGEGLPPGYVDPEHTGCDREILEAFYAACRSEGGTADEIHLRGLHAVLARFGGRPAPAPAGAVADSVAVLEREAEAAEQGNLWMAPSELRQAATLLRQQQLRIALLERRQAAPLAQCCPTPAPPAEGVDRSHISDGYHTFAELYDHRHSLMLALMRAIPQLCWFSQRHADGEMPFGTTEWFIAGADLPAGAITYHLPSELLPLAQQTGAAELPVGRPWDGHTANDVIERLRAWAASPQPAPPAEGEVGELVPWLRSTGEGQPCLSDEGYARLTRTADLLEQRHPTPAPVSERPWEREGWCDESGRCWFYSPRFQAWSLTISPTTTEQLRAMIGYLSLPFHALPLPSTADEFVLDTLERLRHASISYRMNVYGEEGIRMYEERAARTLALYKPRPRQPAPAPAGEVERDPVIPSCYTGYQIEAYRDGFHAGHRFAHARATIAAKRARWGRPAPAPGKRGGGAMSAAAIRAAIEAELARSPAPPTTDDIAAAVLQAAADQVVPEAANAVGDQHDEARRDQWLRIRWRLLSIAAKLKGE